MYISVNLCHPEQFVSTAFGLKFGFNDFLPIKAIEIYLLNVSAAVSSLHQELNSEMTSSSSACWLAWQRMGGGG